MKNKWRHIRDHFFRVVNKGKSGDAAPKKKKKYIYADSLSFLMSYETKRPTSGNIAATEDENVDEPQESEASEEADETRPVEERPATEKNTATDKNIREPAVKKKKLSAFQSELLKKLDTSSATEEDVDRLYLLSMLSDFKGLTYMQKLDFKIMNLQFFRNVKSVPQYQTRPMMPPANPQPQTLPVMPLSNRQSQTPPMMSPSNPQCNYLNMQQQQYYFPQTSSQYQPHNTAQPMGQQMQQEQTPLLMHQYDQPGGSRYNSAASPTSVYASPTESMHSDCSC
ncbi:hypothetical protein J6590_107431 [Homalodisca vitripennis]|nr:hypothetical protein J6590_107431 [Homalodisca vitripennis]